MESSVSGAPVAGWFGMLTWRLTHGKSDKLILQKLLRKTGSFGCFEHGWGCIISG